MRPLVAVEAPSRRQRRLARDLREVLVQEEAGDEFLPRGDAGTHTGSFRGLPPTNRQVRFSALEINRMRDGKVAEHWFQLDAVTLFEQLGLRIVPGPRLLPRLLASPITRLLAKRRRTVPA